jgi:hypothetical protein
MQIERDSDVASSGSTWDKIAGGLNHASSLPFMEIRMRSLGKAMDEVRMKRARLEESKRRGHVNDSEYAASLLKIIVETNTLTKERDDIADRIQAMRK